MMRRTFLQQTGLALLTLLASETGLLRWGKNSSIAPELKNYQNALAEPTNRKLALLVGINSYSRNLQLAGSLTDVKLQKELLVNRFGFQPSDILTLIDREATRDNIERAFLEHLTAQAESNDVVVVHFSGYGMEVNLPEAIAAQNQLELRSENNSLNLTKGLVTADNTSLAKNTSIVNGILEETLAMLIGTLATEKVTLILDTSYKIADNPLVGALRTRSLPVISTQPSPEELSFQQEIQQKYSLPPKKIGSGIILQAAGVDRIATEAVWNGFSAGLFTHALTQYLWQVTPASKVTVSLARTTEAIESLGIEEQKPLAIFNDKKPLLTYYSLPESAIGAEGFIEAIEDSETVTIHLGGIPATILNNYEVGSCFTTLVAAADLETVDPADRDSTPEMLTLQIRSREGLSAKVKTLSSSTDRLKVGQPIRESIRIVPRNLGAIVALDANLQRIERVDATSAFANINPVSEVVTAGESAADYLFGRVKPTQIAATKQQSNSETPDSSSAETEDKDKSQSLGGYGIFTLDGTLVPNTLGSATEAVKSAVRRLVPQFETLLAAKLWSLSLNQGSSNLGVRATLALLEPENKILLKQETLRSQNSLEKPFENISVRDLPDLSEGDSVVKIESGSKIQYQVENYSDRPIYSLVLGLDSESSPIALYSPQLNGDSSQLKSNSILPRQTIIIPQPSASLNWIVSGAKGIAKIYVICSVAPFDRTLNAFLAQQHPKGDKERVLDLPNPLEVAKALLSDLHSASAVSSSITSSISTDVWALDVNAWASFSFVYQVI
ncbi:MAG: caspase family protein [Prochloraceae cyanobacterium]